MANPIVLTNFANPDPNAAPLNIGELIKLLNQLVQSAIIGSYTPYVIGSTTPGTDDQDKAWLKLDHNGRPLGTFTFYQGKWRRIYNGMLGEIRMYAGDPTDTTDGFDKNGLGIVQGLYDGWHLCNGMDGTPNFSNHFIIAANMADLTIGYGTDWRTNVEGGAAVDHGGNFQTTLNAANTYRPATPAVLVDKYSVNNNNNDPSGILYGVNSVQHIPLVPADLGNTAPTPVDIMNPYIALGFILFVGYA
jgi:hypothetical protein